MMVKATLLVSLWGLSVATRVSDWDAYYADLYSCITSTAYCLDKATGDWVGTNTKQACLDLHGVWYDVYKDANALRADVDRHARANPSAPQVFLVQVSEDVPVTMARRLAWEKSLGTSLDNYIPCGERGDRINTRPMMYVFAQESALQALRQDGVAVFSNIMPVPLALRRSPGLSRSLHRTFEQREVELVASVLDNGRARAQAVQGLRGRLSSVTNATVAYTPSNGMVSVKGVRLAQVDQVTQTLLDNPAAWWVDRKQATVAFNFDANHMYQSGSFVERTATWDPVPANTPFWNAGIKGQGQIVGIGDTGLDWKSCFFKSSKDPIPSTLTKGQNHKFPNNDKIVQYYAYADTGYNAEFNGGDHGTHCAGTIAGEEGEAWGGVG